MKTDIFAFTRGRLQPQKGSIEELMDRFEQDLAPEIAENTSVEGARAVSLECDREYPGAEFLSEDEVRQKLVITRQGEVSLRSYTWNKGHGRGGIGRVLDTSVSPVAVKEIFRMLDVWNYGRPAQTWQPQKNCGTWTLRILQGNDHQQMLRGNLTGASAAGWDLSDFIRSRIPVQGLYLFDERL